MFHLLLLGKQTSPGFIVLRPMETLAINWGDQRGQLAIALALVEGVLPCSGHYPFEVIVLALDGIALRDPLHVFEYEGVLLVL